MDFGGYKAPDDNCTICRRLSAMNICGLITYKAGMKIKCKKQ